jgi:hypothetical protein
MRFFDSVELSTVEAWPGTRQSDKQEKRGLKKEKTSLWNDIDWVFILRLVRFNTQEIVHMTDWKKNQDGSAEWTWHRILNSTSWRNVIWSVFFTMKSKIVKIRTNGCGPALNNTLDQSWSLSLSIFGSLDFGPESSIFFFINPRRSVDGGNSMQKWLGTRWRLSKWPSPAINS